MKFLTAASEAYVIYEVTLKYIGSSVNSSHQIHQGSNPYGIDQTVMFKTFWNKISLGVVSGYHMFEIRAAAENQQIYNVTKAQLSREAGMIRKKSGGVFYRKL